MAVERNTNGIFNYNNIEKKNKNFMYSNFKRGNCFNCNFSNSNFDYVSLRGAHLKSCVLNEASFKYAEFIGSNLKNSTFIKSIFENTIFESANVSSANFKDAIFTNTIFLTTDIKKAKNLKVTNPEIRIFDEMPQIAISEDLKDSVICAMKNKFVKESRVLDTKDGSINLLSIMILLENFDEQMLIKGLEHIQLNINKSFHTLSYLIKYIKNSNP